MENKRVGEHWDEPMKDQRSKGQVRKPWTCTIPAANRRRAFAVVVMRRGNDIGCGAAIAAHCLVSSTGISRIRW